MKLMILDGNSVINRAYFGVKPLTTRDGLYTHAVYGFLNILERMEKEENPDAVCVAFDLHGPTFRHARYEGYKANRHGMPEELAQQMPVMKQVLTAMNIPIYSAQGWEADDVIGTVGKKCGQENWDCVVVTGDRDSLQLIDDHVKIKLVISKPGQTTATLYDEAKFREEYGFAPKRMVDLKALMGDSSDNIPGVAGVGPKTATDLLLKFGTLDGVYANLEDASIRPKLREKLTEGKDSAYLSYELATIIPEAPIEFEPKDALRKEYNKPELYALFQKLEFVRLIDRYGLRGAAAEAALPAKANVKSLPSADTLPGALSKCALYFASDGSLGIAWEEGVCALTPMELQMSQLPKLDTLVLHDARATMHLLGEAGIAYGSVAFDTALAAYDLNPSQSDYPVSKLATTFLGKTVEDGDAAACAEAVWLLAEPLKAELEKQGETKLYEEIELPLCAVLYRMECRGIAIDRNQLVQFGKMLEERIADCENLIYGYSDGTFNIQSPKQLGTVLFEKLGLPAGKKTKTGYSTNADVLEKLKDKHPIIPAIMDYRMLTKLKGTYADGLMKVIGPDGRIHTTFQNLVTATGRLSSTDPNLQNIPVRTERGKLIRAAVVPRDVGHLLVSADYSQIELRIMAAMSGDESMLDAFAHGADIHRETAARVYDVMPALVTDDMRRTCKMVNFGIIYGISAFGLSQRLHIPRKEAAGLIDTYFRLYPKIRAFMDTSIAKAREAGYAVTALGRRRTLRDIASRNATARQSAERDAINTPIQGTAADLIKLAMVKVDRALKAADLRAKMILQIHDELLFDVPKDEVEQVKALAKREMEGAMSLGVPLEVSVGVGANWLEAH